MFIGYNEGWTIGWFYDKSKLPCFGEAIGKSCGNNPY